MYGSGPTRGPLTRGERWTCAIFAVIFLSLFVAEIVTNYQPAKLSALLIVLFWIPLLALHEASHALVANLLGWYVGQVIIGMGRTVGSFRIGSARVEIRLVPIEGFVRCVPTNLRNLRLKSALIYAAGPGVELLLAGVILAMVGPDRLLSRSNDYWIISLQSLTLAAAMGGVLNLIPQMVVTSTGNVPNDGLGIFLSFFRPESHYAAMTELPYEEIEELRDGRDPADWWKQGPDGRD